jgi:tRNA(Ile)-lysidine synthase
MHPGPNAAGRLQPGRRRRVNARLPSAGATPDRLFAALDQAAAIVAAVSGGPDSIALMHLLARWSAGRSGPALIVATVDHGLRPESADEAAFVAREAAALGLPHRTLAWTGEKPRTRLQEAAREARYRLLVESARQEGASHLATAHTLDDQAETVMMRIARGSGLTGLAGMRAERDLDGIRHVRPLLSCPKAALVGLCEREEWPFVTDPSNRNEHFARVRWRRILPALAAEGLTAERLARLAQRAARAEAALDVKASEALTLAAPTQDGEGVVLDGRRLGEEPFEIALRMLSRALGTAGLSRDPSRLHRLETCTQRLREALRAGEALRVTVAGALVRLDRTGRLAIRPEPPRRRGR